jgi:hypothetical protein
MQDARLLENVEAPGEDWVAFYVRFLTRRLQPAGTVRSAAGAGESELRAGGPPT